MVSFAKEFVTDAVARRLMGAAYDDALIKEARNAYAQTKRKAFYLLEDAGLSRPLISKLCQVRPQHVHNELNNRKPGQSAADGRSVVARVQQPTTRPPSGGHRANTEPTSRSPSLCGEGRRLFLISCVKTKRTATAAAKDLYISDWFRKARACVEGVDGEWRILSAEYGAVHPNDEIRPYEKTLNTMPVAERRAWAQRVLNAIDSSLLDIDTVVFLAGKRYREFLEPALHKRGVDVDVPMRDLSQGRQLAWLGACIEATRGSHD